MQEEVFKAALAGLLHDVGKFAQRGGWQGGAHAEVGAEFVRQYAPAQWQGDLYPVMGHHDRPVLDRPTKVVALADRLAAAEREDQGEAQPQQLLAIWCQVEADSQQIEPTAYWPLAPLAMEQERVFPGPAWHREQVRSAYADMWQGFCAKAQRLQEAHQPGSDPAAYLESLLLLMQRYTWCIPAAYYRSTPDVSLYDHSRMTAALAACLAGRPEDELDAMLKGEDGGGPTAVLVGGDISGVQDFIYTLSARGAASALRGRSFYLQLLTEAAARFTLDRLQMPICNLIYGGGGHFYLLAPPLPDLEERLLDAQRHISQTLLRHHGGDLYLALGTAPLGVGDLRGRTLSARWQETGHALHAAKGRRFSELGTEMHHQVFQPWRDQGNEARECQVCHHEHEGTTKDGEISKCPPCRGFEELGEALRQAKALYLEQVPIQAPEDGPAGTWQEALRHFGLAPRLLEDVPQGTLPGRGVLLALRDEALDRLRPGRTTAVGRRFLVNVTPTLTAKDIQEARQERVTEELPPPGRVKPFSVLEVQSEGIHRLGVLRMDVDNLGALFSDGLGERATLSRVASLSQAVSLFFEGWVETLAERHNRAGGADTDRVYSIYSGGDDLFMVGSWDAIPRLALEIRADWSRFAAGHPGVHLCGGIALIGGKYPLYQAAREAAEAEQSAKAQPGKDAVTFLGQTVCWETLALAADWKDRLVRMHREQDVPRSLLRTLIDLQRAHDDEALRRARQGQDRTQAREPQALAGPWIWQAAYALARAEKRYNGVSELGELRQLLAYENFTSIRWIGLAARWAELELRDRV